MIYPKQLRTSKYCKWDQSVIFDEELLAHFVSRCSCLTLHCLMVLELEDWNFYNVQTVSYLKANRLNNIKDKISLRTFSTLSTTYPVRFRGGLGGLAGAWSVQSGHKWQAPVQWAMVFMMIFCWIDCIYSCHSSGNCCIIKFIKSTF